MTVVVKLGGSLGEGPAARQRLARALALLAVAPPAVVVGGGGPFADAVRGAQTGLAFSDALAHRLAIAGMAAYAEVLAEIEPGLTVAPTLEDAARLLAEGRRPLWTAAEAADPGALAPGRLLAATGPLARERSWRVTSDSLAALAARALGLRRLVVVKSAPPSDPTAPLVFLAATGYVDAAFPEAAAGLDVRFLGPAEHARLAEVIAAAPAGAA